jgi:phage repressor protein C with HTH and peptisase S24 domain
MMQDLDDIRQRLDALIQTSDTDYAALSKMLGRNAAYIQQYIKRGVPRRLSEEDRYKLAQFFGVSEEVLGGPKGQVGRAMRPQEAERAGQMVIPDYVLIPHYNVAAAAGAGALPGWETSDSALAFQSRWVRTIATGGVDALAVIRVEGDSMYPTLSDGDNILLDTADCERLRDGIYVLRIEDALMVKRIAINPIARTLTIMSDNSAYPSWRDVEVDKVHIIGRVVWVGRRL